MPWSNSRLEDETNQPHAPFAACRALMAALVHPAIYNELAVVGICMMMVGQKEEFM